MIHTEKVPKGKIVTDRQLDPDDLEWIQHGPDSYPNPMPLILVDQNYRLLDGLRRLQAFRPDERVPVYVSDNLSDSCTYIQSVPEGTLHTSRRGWELFCDLEFQRTKHMLETRNGKGGTKRSAGRSKNNLSRRMIARALGLSDHRFQVLLYLYGRAYGLYKVPPEHAALAQEYVKRLEAGYNIHTADREYQEELKAQKLRIVTEGDQRAALSSIAASLGAMIHTLQDIGTLHPRITAAEATQWAPLFAVARAEIRRLAFIVNERAKS